MSFGPLFGATCLALLWGILVGEEAKVKFRVDVLEILGDEGQVMDASILCLEDVCGGWGTLCGGCPLCRRAQAACQGYASRVVEKELEVEDEYAWDEALYDLEKFLDDEEFDVVEAKMTAARGKVPERWEVLRAMEEEPRKLELPWA